MDEFTEVGTLKCEIRYYFEICGSTDSCCEFLTAPNYCKKFKKRLLKTFIGSTKRCRDCRKQFVGKSK